MHLHAGGEGQERERERREERKRKKERCRESKREQRALLHLIMCLEPSVQSCMIQREPHSKVQTISGSFSLPNEDGQNVIQDCLESVRKC